jgi:N-acetyl-gamma-glutamyl-phosphate reductase
MPPRESVGLITNPAVRVIDGSTATAWRRAGSTVSPSLKPGQRAAIQKSNRVTVPRLPCDGFILMLYPLVARGIVGPDYPVSCHAIAGYSGGGRSMIADYERADAPDYVKNPRPYALGLNHKHIPEMTKYSGLTRPPTFTPTVVNVYSGEIGSIPLAVPRLEKALGAAEIREVLAEHYAGEEFIKVMPYPAGAYLKNGL